MGEGVRGPGAVCPNEDLPVEVSPGDLLHGKLQNVEVIAGGVCPGVTGPKQPGERLAGFGEIGHQRVKTEAAFSISGGLAFLAVECKEGGVEIDDETFRPGPGLPGGIPCLGPGNPDRFQLIGTD